MSDSVATQIQVTHKRDQAPDGRYRPNFELVVVPRDVQFSQAHYAD